MLELATTLLHSLWQATLLAGLLWLVSRHRGLSAFFRYRLAYGTLLAQVALSVGTYLHYRSPAPRLEGEVKQLVVEWVARPSGVVTEATPTYWLHALVLIWGGSIVLGSYRTVVSFGRGRRMKSRSGVADAATVTRVRELAHRLGYAGRLAIRVGREVTTPVLVGFVKPVLLLPVALTTQLTTQEAEAVLLHELAHLRRRDPWWNLLQCLIQILFYYHPAVHWIGARIREEREYCCDDWVLRYGPGGLPYARALLHYGEQEVVGNPMTLSLTDGGGLLARVQRFLLNQPIHYTMQRNFLLLPLVALTVLVATAVYAPAPVVELLPPASAPALASDTLPPGNHEVTKISNGKTTKVKIDDGQISELIIEDTVVPPAQYGNHEGTAEALLRGTSQPWGFDFDPEELHVLADRALRSVNMDSIMRELEDVQLQLELDADSLAQIATYHLEHINIDSLIESVQLTSQEQLRLQEEALATVNLELLKLMDSLPLQSWEMEATLEGLERQETYLKEQLRVIEEQKEILRQRGD